MYCLWWNHWRSSSFFSVSHSVCPGMNVSESSSHLSQNNVDFYSGCTIIDGHFVISDVTNNAILSRYVYMLQHI